MHSCLFNTEFLIISLIISEEKYITARVTEWNSWYELCFSFSNHNYSKNGNLYLNQIANWWIESVLSKKIHTLTNQPSRPTSWWTLEQVYDCATPIYSKTTMSCGCTALCSVEKEELASVALLWWISLCTTVKSWCKIQFSSLERRLDCEGLPPKPDVYSMF